MRPPERPSFLATLTGSFSMPAADNPTVAMMEAAYAGLGVNWRYLNCEVSPQGLAAAVDGAEAMGWRGFNCSLPHKVSVINHLDTLTDAASLIGAVNCVFRRGDGWVGDNTDGKGFVDALQQVAPLAGASMLIMGAGGAARAIAVESALAGCREILISNRTEGRGVSLTDQLTHLTPARSAYIAAGAPVVVPPHVGIVVNATPVGMPPHEQLTPSIDLESLREDLVVCDVVPNPPMTPLLQEAATRGCRTVDGLNMLVNQAIAAIRRWTGLQADPTVMRTALEAALRI